MVQSYSSQCNVGIVCNQNESGQNSWQKSLRWFAKQHGVREYQLEELYQIDYLLFLSLEFDRIISPKLFQPTARLYNVHFSLLPQYKGMYTSAWPILNGEIQSGVTLHKIDAGIDTGDIICQKKFPLESRCTGRDLYMQYIRCGTELALNCLDDIINDRVQPVPQSTQNSTYYSKESIDYTNIKVDLNQTACAIDRQIRAYNFREYQIPEVYGKRIISAEITAQKSDEKPGTVLFSNSVGMLISTIDYNTFLYFDDSSEFETGPDAIL